MNVYVEVFPTYNNNVMLKYIQTCNIVVMLKFLQTCNIVVMWTGGDVEVSKAIVSHAVTIIKNV